MGARRLKLRAVLETASANCEMYAVQTRDALIEYLGRYKTVHKIVAAKELAAAA
jgi:hypothetical protein